MTLPDRFCDATFENYEPQTPSQAEALRIAREFVAGVHRTPSWTERIRKFLGAMDDRLPQGLYFVGPAGTGKTHLLAAVYNALGPPEDCAFLHSSTLFRQTEPPDAFAHRLADQYAVCCLDEVEIDDPANEMRLAGVMKTLAARGVPLLATSNVAPEEYLATQLGDGRIQRFLRTEVREAYRVVPVRGEDYRRTREVQQSGRGWIGPPEGARWAMRQAEADASGPSRWWSFADLRRATTETAHSNLVDDLTALDHLFIEGVTIADTDDAFRLLRIVDALYLHADAPTLYFTAEQPPDDWFAPDQHAGLAQAVAEKFDRTVSRLHALCRVQEVGQEGVPHS
ncbi:AFG1/ZapE family ATPase [Salinibacter altiplanensis]|uniref:AFG1/ZapE family ATPase n=1 Tax=Salinibacter altiplanensis TaxID=1803181 RepID=UPI000C9EF751|nr:AFG1/ZapE family ATPase [Salinibacter altiplanensis]